MKYVGRTAENFKGLWCGRVHYFFISLPSRFYRLCAIYNIPKMPIPHTFSIWYPAGISLMISDYRCIETKKKCMRITHKTHDMHRFYRLRDNTPSKTTRASSPSAACSTYDPIRRQFLWMRVQSPTIATAEVHCAFCCLLSCM